jgi:hypothetical protein
MRAGKHEGASRRPRRAHGHYRYAKSRADMSFFDAENI